MKTTLFKIYELVGLNRRKNWFCKALNKKQKQIIFAEIFTS